MSKLIGVTKEIYDLVKVLEKYEDEINFSVFYSFSQILESYHFCPGFYHKETYYEIQYNDVDCLKVLDFGEKEWKEMGDELTEKDIIELTENIKKYYAK